MKFDFAIGNPPYQEAAPGDSTSEYPVYHLFMDAAFEVADKVELITPARFLFNAGKTPKQWNEKILYSDTFKVLLYESDSNKIFPSQAITGGIAISINDKINKTEPIITFCPYQELNSIYSKVVDLENYVGMDTIISGRTPYLFTELLHEDYPDAEKRLSKGHRYDISSNVFETLPNIFCKEVPKCDKDFYRILGRLSNARTYLWINKIYVHGRTSDLIGKWKVFLPKANGASGMLGDEAARLISKPVIGKPEDIATDTFVVVGSFNTETEANAAYKYITGKFARVLLGMLKVTQINSKETWKKVPLQDFSSHSDIDWTLSTPEIDKQLYRKYNLSDVEIGFIEAHVKEME